MKLGKIVEEHGRQFLLNRLGHLFLRPMSLKPDEYPKIIRASTIASYWWCAWKSFGSAVLGIKIPEKEWMALGTVIHEKLFESLGKRFPWEQKFVEEIDEYRKSELGFVRKFGLETEIILDITGHPDDFQVTPDGEVSVIEYKTTGMPLFLAKRFLLPVAKFQAKLYPYVMEPIVNEAGYSIAKSHAVVIYSSHDLSLLHWQNVYYDPVAIENEVREILGKYRDPNNMKPCVPWKCKYCDAAFKERCPFYKPPTK